MSPTVRRLAPSGGIDDGSVVDLDEWYGADRPRLRDRPWVAVNMIASIDGAVVLHGRSGALGNETDRRVLGALRRAAAIILVGAGTVADERYGPPKKAGQRVAVVSNRGRVDPTSELFTSGSGLLVTNRRAVAPGTVETLRCGDETLDLAGALRQLGHRLDPGGWVIAEGGPTLNGALLALDLIDELNITTAPLVVGGEGPRAVASTGEFGRRFRLAHQLADDDGYLFSRWIRSGEVPSAGG